VAVLEAVALKRIAKTEDGPRVVVPEKSSCNLRLDPHESLIPDPGAGLTPAERVRRKLMTLLDGGRKQKGEWGRLIRNHME
jgi:hypothetical protein